MSPTNQPTNGQTGCRVACTRLTIAIPAQWLCNSYVIILHITPTFGQYLQTSNSTEEQTNGQSRLYSRVYATKMGVMVTQHKFFFHPVGTSVSSLTGNKAIYPAT